MGRNGYTARADEQAGVPIRVVIEVGNSPAQQAKTAIHEAAHIVLGHLQDDFAEYVAHRGRYEVEAESVAYVVAGMLGLDSSDYSTGYVTGWVPGRDGRSQGDGDPGTQRGARAGRGPSDRGQVRRSRGSHRRCVTRTLTYGRVRPTVIY